MAGQQLKDGCPRCGARSFRRLGGGLGFWVGPGSLAVSAGLAGKVQWQCKKCNRVAEKGKGR